MKKIYKSKIVVMMRWQNLQSFSVGHSIMDCKNGYDSETC